MDTVGFGPNANTELLVEIAKLCQGSYALCYDASMVGTIFGRALVRTYMENEVYGIYKERGEYTDNYHMFREKMIELLLTKGNKYELTILINRIEEQFITFFKTHSKEIDPLWYELINDMYSDLNDQISKAISNTSFWTNWGKAYWQTLAIALDKQYSPNFKDKCVQCFGSISAQLEYDRVSDIYDIMPMITPSASIEERTTVIPSTPILFNQRDSGCFHPESLVQYIGNNIITIIGFESLENLMLQHRQNNLPLLLMGPHGPVQVETIIKTMNTNAIIELEFCQIGNCKLTKNHPIKHNNMWIHPRTIVNPFVNNVPFVFNLILSLNHETGKRYESVLIDNQICICLAHGIENDRVATDGFWGTERIVNEIRRLYPNQYDTGVIEFRHTLLRNHNTGYIDQII